MINKFEREIMNEKNTFIVRYGETALKGENKPFFERMLAERLRKLLRKFTGTAEERRKDGSKVIVERNSGLIFVKADKSIDVDEIMGEILKVFGIASISMAVECNSTMDDIKNSSIEYINKYMSDNVKNDITFKVEARRADKNFPVKSPEIAREVGAAILKGCNDINKEKKIKVDVHNPDIHLFVNLREKITYIYQQKIEGQGGLPLGTTGKGMLLLSGGIDSPVAGFMMGKRGMKIEAVHFHSYPYTNQKAKEQVEELASIIAIYMGGFKVHMVNLLPIQEAIVENCIDDDTTIHIRRYMMMIAERIAVDREASVLITGESLGQVASQTTESLIATNHAVSMPVMRPLIALDKVEIMEKAKKIGTFEVSIQPNDDCCTIFLPKHPTTKPKIERLLESESKINAEKLINEAIEKAEIVDIKPKT